MQYRASVSDDLNIYTLISTMSNADKFTSMMLWIMVNQLNVVYEIINQYLNKK